MTTPAGPMGAIPTSGGGTGFRVWGPNATSVTLRWTPPLPNGGADVPMVAEPGGYWFVHVDEAKAGDRYQYVIVNPAATPAVPPRPDPWAPELDITPADSRQAVVYDQSAFGWNESGYHSPGWTELIIYEMHVGTFNELPGQQCGTFDDAIAKLPYLEALGITAIELLPPVQVPELRSWGYDPSDPFAVDAGYGGPDGLKRFVAAAHGQGISVIIDVVYTHMGNVDDDLWAFDGPTPPPAGIYVYPDGRCATPWGDSRFDYGRPEVRQFLVDNARQWLEDYRADGLRFDATEYIRSVDGSLSPDQDLPDGWRLVQSINDAIDARQPWKICIAEDLRNDSGITTPTWAGGAGFNSQWDADFVHGVRGVLEQISDDGRDMNVIDGALRHRYGADGFARVVYTESHDEDANGRTRLPTEINPNDPTGVYSKKRSVLGAVLVFTAPGIPMIFQGQEMLETHWFDSDYGVDWTNAQRFAGIVTLYTDLIALRRDLSNTTHGLRGQNIQVHHINNNAKLVGYHRWDAGGPRDDTMVLLNFSHTTFGSYTVGLPRPGTWKVRLNTDWTGYDASFGDAPSFDVATRDEQYDGLPFAADVAIGAYAAVILSQDE